MRRLALTAIAALWVAVAQGPAMAQDLTPGQMRALGFDLLSAGETGRAMVVADALLARDPQDAVALILRARVLRDMGRDAEARKAARVAWAAADTPSDRFGAALTRAQVLSSSGNRTAAQLWLRKAMDAAPTPAARSVAMRDFRYVRGRNPLRLSFSLGVAPSSNVNNGSRHDEIAGFGMFGALSPDAQALSGWTGQASVGARFRLAESERRSTWLRLSATRREVRLSSESTARLDKWVADQAALGVAANPRRNFDFGAVELGLNQTLGFQKGMVQLGATLGRNWFGGDLLSDYLKLDMAGERGLTPRRALYGEMSLERQWRHDSAFRDADLITVEGGMVQALASGDRLRIGFGARRAHSFSPEVRHGAVLARLGWEKAQPVAGVRIETSLGIERRDYDASLLAPSGRRDLRLDAGVSLTFETLDYMGFAPTLDLRASRFRSNVKLYDGRDVGLSLGFRSVF